VTSMASAPPVDGGVATVVAERWRCVAGTAVIAVVRPLTRWGHPTLERDVASLSASFSWLEGREEAAME
jgi:hypothetical protein